MPDEGRIQEDGTHERCSPTSAPTPSCFISRPPPTDKKGAETPVTSAEPFRPTEFRNSVPLLPCRETTESLTTDFVKRLLDGEDEEWLRASRSGRR